MAELKTYLTGSDEVRAVRWYKNGDHPKDKCEFIELSTETDGEQDVVLSEGQVVRRFRQPGVSDDEVCSDCGYTMKEHGWIDSPPDGAKVCPGDYVITNQFRDTYPTKPEEFEATYRPA